MRSPEAARALPAMVADGLLEPDEAAPLLAVARGDMVSLRAELRALLGLAVIALTTGAGLWVAEHRDRLGPWTIAVLMGLAVAAAFALLARRSPPFGWARAAEKDWTIDGLVLLVVGLLGAELGWIETQFAALGESWPYHLLVMSLVTGALGVRFDSIPTWALALSTFAAWRGVALTPRSLDPIETTLFGHEDRLRVELIVCGALFLALAVLARRLHRKRHFEPTTTFLAFLAAAIGCVGGLGEDGEWEYWAVALGVLGAVTAAWAFRRRRRALLAVASLAVYVALTRFLAELKGAMAFGCFWLFASTIGAIVLLVVVHRHFERTEEG